MNQKKTLWAKKKFISKWRMSIAVILVAITCIIFAEERGLDMKTQKKDYRENGAMEKDFRVNYVLNIEKDPAQKRAKISTHQSGILWLDEKFVTDFSKYLKTIRLAMREKKPLAIEFNVDTREISFVNYAAIDWIPYVQDVNAPGDYIEVGVLIRPSRLRLYRNHPRFKELYDRLLKAQAGYKDTLEGGLKAIIANDAFDLYDVLLLEEK
jgi:hypothetical protein